MADHDINTKLDKIQETTTKTQLDVATLVANQKHLDRRVSALEANQKWVICAVILIVITAVVGQVLKN